MLCYTVRQRLDGSGSWQRCHCELDMSRDWVAEFTTRCYTQRYRKSQIREDGVEQKWQQDPLADMSYKVVSVFCLVRHAQPLHKQRRTSAVCLHTRRIRFASPLRRRRSNRRNIKMHPDYIGDAIARGWACFCGGMFSATRVYGVLGNCSAMNQQPQRTGVHEMCPPKNHIPDWMRTLLIGVEAGQCIEPHLKDYFELSLSTLLMSLEEPCNGSLAPRTCGGEAKGAAPVAAPLAAPVAGSIAAPIAGWL